MERGGNWSEATEVDPSDSQKEGNCIHRGHQEMSLSHQDQLKPGAVVIRKEAGAGGSPQVLGQPDLHG